jgi:hypothetical protein
MDLDPTARAVLSLSLPVLADGWGRIPSHAPAASHLVLGDLLSPRHKKGISALQLQRDTGIGSYKTAIAVGTAVHP